MEIQQQSTGFGRVPVKSTEAAPHQCRPQNQWAPDSEVGKWENEIEEIFHDAAVGQVQQVDQAQTGQQQQLQQAPMDSELFLAQGPTQTPDIQPEIRHESTEKSVMNKATIRSEEEFPPLGTDSLTQNRDQEMAQEKPMFGSTPQEHEQLESSLNAQLPRHGMPLDTFIEHGIDGKPQRNIEDKAHQDRDELAPKTGIRAGEGLRHKLDKKQVDDERMEVDEPEKEHKKESKERKSSKDEPELSPPDEADKEKKEKVKTVVGEVKHVAEVIGSTIVSGVEGVKEMLSDAVHHLTDAPKDEQTEGKTVREEYGYNTCA
ncbi:unnamed protein product, partial [Mesorhabditis spiculigera]